MPSHSQWQLIALMASPGAPVFVFVGTAGTLLAIPSKLVPKVVQPRSTANKMTNSARHPTNEASMSALEGAILGPKDKPGDVGDNGGPAKLRGIMDPPHYGHK